MNLENFTLLYVEDDKQTQEAMSEILRLYLKEVYVASDGYEGLELFKKHSPDIVLTDIQMPIMDGFKMSSEIKSINMSQPIIVLTAFKNIETLRNLIDIGIDKYITKPVVSIEHVLSVIREVGNILQTKIDKQKLEKIVQSQNKLTSMGEMLSNISHQWRQPLGVINAIAIGLEMNIELGKDVSLETVKENMKKICLQSKYLSDTIDDFRNFIRDDSSLLHQFNLKSMMKKVFSLVEDSYTNSFIEIIQNIEDMNIEQSENELIQVIINILNNARDAFSDKLLKNKYLFIDTVDNGETCKVIIKDNAGGIPEDIIDKIFDPYFTTKFEDRGTGIGLYMSNEIMTKNYKGSISVENSEYVYNDEPHKGAKFTLTLPVNKD